MSVYIYINIHHRQLVEQGVERNDTLFREVLTQSLLTLCGGTAVAHRGFCVQLLSLFETHDHLVRYIYIYIYLCDCIDIVSIPTHICINSCRLNRILKTISQFWIYIIVKNPNTSEYLLTVSLFSKKYKETSKWVRVTTVQMRIHIIYIYICLHVSLFLLFLVSVQISWNGVCCRRCWKWSSCKAVIFLTEL